MIARATEHTFQNPVHGRDIFVEAAVRPTVGDGRIPIAGVDHLVRGRQVGIAPEDLHSEDRRLPGLLEGVRHQIQKRFAVGQRHSVVSFTLVVQAIHRERPDLARPRRTGCEALAGQVVALSLEG